LRFSDQSEASPHARHLLFNKPYGVLTRFTDDNGRPTLADFISVPLVYPAGRLDFDSEGLLVLTSDGKLAHRLTDPRFEHPKTYYAQVERLPDEESLKELRRGILLGDGPCRPAEVELLDADPVPWERTPPIRFRKTVPTAWLKLTIREGRNRQVRRMTAAIGHPCLRLVRWQTGTLTIEGLMPGQWRELTDEDLSGLIKNL
jgi:23S rRNA pseudouridine2457 synthase